MMTKLQETLNYSSPVVKIENKTCSLLVVEPWRSHCSNHTFLKLLVSSFLLKDLQNVEFGEVLVELLQILPLYYWPALELSQIQEPL